MMIPRQLWLLNILQLSPLFSANKGNSYISALRFAAASIGKHVMYLLPSHNLPKKYLAIFKKVTPAIHSFDICDMVRLELGLHIDSVPTIAAATEIKHHI